jgi:hypothetical protein
MELFKTQFDPANLPNSFAGEVLTMFKVAKAFVEFSAELALSRGLVTDV